MDIQPDSLEMAFWDIELDIDPASATVQIYMAGSWQTAAWAAAADHTGDTWTRTAQLLLAGANPGSGITPARTDNYPLVKVTVGGEAIIRKSTTRLTITS